MIFSYYRAHQIHFQSTAQLFEGSFSLGARRVEGRRGEGERGEEGDRKSRERGEGGGRREQEEERKGRSHQSCVMEPWVWRYNCAVFLDPLPAPSLHRGTGTGEASVSEFLPSSFLPPSFPSAAAAELAFRVIHGGAVMGWCHLSQSCVCWSLSHIQLFATPWTIARQAPLSMGVSRQKCWGG